jgi:hypothetical protein
VWSTSDFDLAGRDSHEAGAAAERADAMTQGYVYGWGATFGAVRRYVPLTGLNARRLLKLVAYTGLRTWAPSAERVLVTINVGRQTILGRRLRAARPALKEVGHDKIVTPLIGCSRPRRRFATAAPTRRSPGRGASRPRLQWTPVMEF